MSGTSGVICKIAAGWGGAQHDMEQAERMQDSEKPLMASIPPEPSKLHKAAVEPAGLDPHI